MNQGFKLVSLELSKEEVMSLHTALEAYKHKYLQLGLECHVPHHFGNITSILNQLTFIRRDIQRSETKRNL